MAIASLRRHWFFLPATAIALGAIVLTRTADWRVEAGLVEAALLFDLAVLLPALYFWCYRSSARSPRLRALAVSCTGVWAASHLIPSEHHQLITHVSWVRYGAIAVLLYVELRVLAALYWAVIVERKSTDSAAIDFSASTGMPLAVARLLAREAAFWKRVLAKPVQLIRRFTGR